jgi:hypothetical protein
LRYRFLMPYHVTSAIMAIDKKATPHEANFAGFGNYFPVSEWGQKG